MTDMMALRKELALQAASKPLASGPEGARQLAHAGRGLAAGAFGDRWTWDYERVSHDCGAAGCMYGLSRLLWPAQLEGKYVEFVLGMGFASAAKIFSDGGRRRGILTHEVTPEMVADDLDAWADAQEAA